MANVAPNPSSGAAGTEFQTIKALRELGHTVDDVWTDELSHHLGHFNLYNLLELPLAYRNALRKRLQSTKYDVVHVNQPMAIWQRKPFGRWILEPSSFIALMGWRLG